MRHRGILAAAVWFVGSIAFAQTPPVRLSVGTAGTSGILGFNLVANDGTSFLVRVAVSAGDSGAVIAGKVAAAVIPSTWAASVGSEGVTFLHYNGSAWTDVSEVDGVQNTADASITLSTAGAQAQVDVTLSPMVAASGYDAHGAASFLTLHISGEPSPLTMVLRPGQAPSSVIDGLVQYLQRAGIGFSYTRVSPNQVRIHLRFATSWVSLQTSDTSLQNGAAVSEKSLNASTGLIDR